MPRVYTKRKMTESQEQQVGQDSVRELTPDGNAMTKARSEPVEDIKSEIETAGRYIKRNAEGRIISNPTRGKKWEEEMAFMNEIITVRVHPTTDKNANPFPEVWVNGRVQRFVRGAEQKVKRMFVDRLARSKGTTFDNVKTKDMDGEDKFVYPSHTAEVYPFVVINDSPKGEQWLKKVLSEAA